MKPVLYLTVAISFIIAFALIVLSPENSPQEPVPESEGPASILLFGSTTPEASVQEEVSLSESEIVAEKFRWEDLSYFPLLQRTSDLFSSLKENVNLPGFGSEAKAFHEKLEYLEGKESLSVLDRFEKEELVLLRLRKKKDLKQILGSVLEKFKEELSTEQRKEFESELRNLDLEIRSLSKESL